MLETTLKMLGTNGLYLYIGVNCFFLYYKRNSNFFEKIASICLQKLGDGSGGEQDWPFKFLAVLFPQKFRGLQRRVFNLFGPHPPI